MHRLAIALHLYDYSLDLNREVALFWRFPISAAAGLYFFNRYSCLARSTYYVYGMFVSPASLKVWCAPARVSPEHELTTYLGQSCVDQWFLNTTMDLAPLLPVAGMHPLRIFMVSRTAAHLAQVLLVYARMH